MRNIITKIQASPENPRSRGDEGPMAEAHEFHEDACAVGTRVVKTLHPGRLVRWRYSSLRDRIEGVNGS